MKKSWWRTLAQKIAYPKSWPTVFAYWIPIGDENVPPRIGVSIDGTVQWYEPVRMRGAA